jgi:FtsH-binding integral membrane protein
LPTTRAPARRRSGWPAGATALFIAGFGAAGYATRRDLSGLARLCFWALVALIVFGIVTIFINIPNGSPIYSVLGLLIFAGLTMFDFQRLRRSSDLDSAPLLAASIFLDALNVFLFFPAHFLPRRLGLPAQAKSASVYAAACGNNAMDAV